MPPLRVDVYNPGSDEWIQLKDLGAEDRVGTVSDNTPEGRYIYLFGVDKRENKAFIKKSTTGLDVNIGPNRVVSSMASVIVASLDLNESHELTVKTDRSKQPRRMRFTYFAEM